MRFLYITVWCRVCVWWIYVSVFVLFIPVCNYGLQCVVVDRFISQPTICYQLLVPYVEIFALGSHIFRGASFDIARMIVLIDSVKLFWWVTCWPPVCFGECLNAIRNCFCSAFQFSFHTILPMYLRVLRVVKSAMVEICMKRFPNSSLLIISSLSLFRILLVCAGQIRARPRGLVFGGGGGIVWVWCLRITL
jgi:hypothetical protein